MLSSNTRLTDSKSRRRTRSPSVAIVTRSSSSWSFSLYLPFLSLFSFFHLKQYFSMCQVLWQKWHSKFLYPYLDLLLLLSLPPLCSFFWLLPLASVTSISDWDEEPWAFLLISSLRAPLFAIWKETTPFEAEFLIETWNTFQDSGRVLSNHNPITSSSNFMPIPDNWSRSP